MPPNNAQELDQDAVRLAKAIRYTESRDNENAAGKSGEFGLYQFMPATWASTTKKYGLDPSDRSRQNQNKAAYMEIKSLKDAGYKPDQIASIWNSGKPEWQGNVGTNKYGVKFDTPDYVKKVGSVYQGLKTNDVPKQVTTTSTVEQPDSRDLLQKAGDVVNTIFPGKQIGQAIGTLGGYLMSPNKETYDLSAPTPLQTTADAAQAALMVGVGVPGAAPVSAFGMTAPTLGTAATVAGRIGQGAAVGAGYGATGSVARGSTDLKEIGTDTAIGAATGGALTGAAEAISGIARTLPKWFVHTHMPKLSPETVDYTVKNAKLGSPSSMLNRSNSELSTIGNRLSTNVKNPPVDFVQPTGHEILTKVVDNFDNAQLTPELIASNLKKMAPLHEKLIDRFVKGDNMTLDELWSLNKALGPKVFKGSVFDTPEIRAGKDVASAVWHEISAVIKSAVGPEDFAAYTQELKLNAALEALVEKMKRSPWYKPSMSDLIYAFGGHVAGGPVGALAGLLGQRALSNPSVGMTAAGLIPRVANPATQSVYSPIKGIISRQLGAGN